MHPIITALIQLFINMARRRWIRPRSYGGPRQRYEFIPWTIDLHTTPVTGTNPFWAYQSAYNIVPPTTQQGIRKVKNFTINLSDDTITGGGTAPATILWAIVLVPEDTISTY